MKSKYFGLLLFCAISSITLAAEVPEQITGGFKKYVDEGVDATWATWTKGSSFRANAGVRDAFTKASATAAGNLGKSLGEELIGVREVSPSFKVLYFTWKFERGPLFIRFNCYRAGNDWIVTWIQCSDILEDIVPGDKLIIEQKRE